MNIALDDQQLRISFQRAESDVAVVAFTGVGLALGGIQTEEFYKTFAAFGRTEACSVIYVIDKNRSWYNGHLDREITQRTNQLLLSLGARRTVTLGNSMGGFGAIVFARRLHGCVQSIAFCPQSSVNDAIVPFESRWPQWRAAISDWTLPDATRELDEGISYDLFFGAEDEIDARHAERFERCGRRNLHIHRIAGCDHNVALHLKRQGALKGLLQELIWPAEHRAPAADPL